MITIVHVERDEDLERFVRFTWKVYQTYPTWVPPLIQQTKQFLSGKSIFFTHCKHRLFMALEHGEIVATGAAFHDQRVCDHYHQKIGLIGYFEALPNKQEAVTSLFKSIEDYLRSLGSEVIWAPFNGSIMHELGLQIDSFDDYPLFLMAYNPPYYHSYFQCNGFKRFKELYAYSIDLLDGRIQRKIQYIKRRALHAQVKIRKIDPDDFREEVYRFAEIYRETFQAHWGYAPQSRDEFYEIFTEFKMALDEDFVLFAEYENRVVGFVLCVPNYNFVIKNLNGVINAFNLLKFFRLKKRIRTARLIAIGVSGEYRGQNIAPLLIAHAFDAMIKKGYTTVEYSWVLAENVASQKAVLKFYGKLYKRYMVYQKILTARI